MNTILSRNAGMTVRAALLRMQADTYVIFYLINIIEQNFNFINESVTKYIQLDF